jgi:xylulokinase
MLYGDSRGAGGDQSKNPSESGEVVQFLAWLIKEHPEAAGYWPAQAVANHALSGVGAIDTVAAMTTLPLFDYTDWDQAVATKAGLSDVARLPTIQKGTHPIGTVAAAGDALLGPGTIDAYGEQLVSGAEDVGDVLVILGSTLIVWAITDEWVELPGIWTIPHTVPARILMGGPSNAGGLFVNWARRLVGSAEAEGSLQDTADPGRVPVWQPYLRGERVPFHDPDRRASLHDLDIGMTAGGAMRGAYEASGFAVRHMLDLSGIDGRRIIATGGGVQDANWLAALADTTGLPVDRVAVPEGAALGAAFLARVTAGLESSTVDAGRWARLSERVEPNARWAAAVADRYSKYRSLAG